MVKIHGQWCKKDQLLFTIINLYPYYQVVKLGSRMSMSKATDPASLLALVPVPIFIFQRWLAIRTSTI